MLAEKSGVFTIHPDPYKPFESDDLEKIIIPQSIRRTSRKTLNRYGVDRFRYFLAWMVWLLTLNGYSQRVIEVRSMRVPTRWRKKIGSLGIAGTRRQM